MILKHVHILFDVTNSCMCATRCIFLKNASLAYFVVSSQLIRLYQRILSTMNTNYKASMFPFLHSKYHHQHKHYQISASMRRNSIKQLTICLRRKEIHPHHQNCWYPWSKIWSLILKLIVNVYTKQDVFQNQMNVLYRGHIFWPTHKVLTIYYRHLLASKDNFCIKLFNQLWTCFMILSINSKENNMSTMNRQFMANVKDTVRDIWRERERMHLHLDKDDKTIEANVTDIN